MQKFSTKIPSTTKQGQPSLFLTMVILAAFSVLYTHTCSAPSSMPEGHLWGSNTFSPAFKRSFQLLRGWINIVVGCWHSTTCCTTTRTNHLQPRKHIRTKPPLLSLINDDSGYAFPLRRRISRQGFFCRGEEMA
jgi:hypothetical protein